MKIFVRAKTHARKERVTKLNTLDSATRETYLVEVCERPEEGKANRAVVLLLAKHFSVSSASVRIVSGHTSRNKVIEIEDLDVRARNSAF